MGVVSFLLKQPPRLAAVGIFLAASVSPVEVLALAAHSLDMYRAREVWESQEESGKKIQSSRDGGTGTQ